MSEPGAMLESAAEALISGDIDAALRQLSRVEKRLEKSVPSSSEDLKRRLDRLVSLAQAAAQGLEDAREIITGAGTSARIVTTYDRCGDARKVHMTKPALGRF